jgi:hypothetical protein
MTLSNKTKMTTTRKNKKNLSPGQYEELLKTLKARFEKGMNRHKDINWAKVSDTVTDTYNVCLLNIVSIYD